MKKIFTTIILMTTFLTLQTGFKEEIQNPIKPAFKKEICNNNKQKTTRNDLKKGSGNKVKYEEYPFKKKVGIFALGGAISIAGYLIVEKLIINLRINSSCSRFTL
ncbi:hypothetical protein KAH94_02275 [bacterium]|nr:hypothetical protein [bacterium]